MSTPHVRLQPLRRFYAVAIALCLHLPATVMGQANKEAPFEPEIAAYEKKDAAAAPPQGGIVFVGSSSFRMWKNLESAFPGVTVLNRGFGGSQLRDSTKYADRIIIPYHPKMVVLYAGDNDLAGGRTPDQVSADFAEFVEKVRASLPDVKIGFVSIKPSPSRWKIVDKIREANTDIKTYIRKNKRMTYIDVFTPMLTKEGALRPELYREDGLHPSDACYTLWQKIIAKHLK